MKAATRVSFAEHIGRTLGRSWRIWARLELQATRWLVAKRWAPSVAMATLRIIEVAALAALAYLALWLALLLVIAGVAAWAAQRAASSEVSEWPLGDAAEHKRSVFYDPIGYDDNPDPRFDKH